MATWVLVKICLEPPREKGQAGVTLGDGLGAELR